MPSDQHQTTLLRFQIIASTDAGEHQWITKAVRVDLQRIVLRCGPRSADPTGWYRLDHPEPKNRLPTHAYRLHRFLAADRASEEGERGPRETKPNLQERLLLEQCLEEVFDACAHYCLY